MKDANVLREQGLCSDFTWDVCGQEKQTKRRSAAFNEEQLQCVCTTFSHEGSGGLVSLGVKSMMNMVHHFEFECSYTADEERQKP